MIRRLLVMAGALLVLAGCGDGSVIPLPATPGGCDAPQDPRWISLAPRCGELRPLDAVWTEDDTAVIVGEGGLALVRRPGSGFVAEYPGPRRALRAAAASAEGRVFAVGDGGTIVELGRSGWSDRSLGGAALRAVDATPLGQAWAVGDQGRVCFRTEQGQWAESSSPGNVDLIDLCRTQDDLLVCAATGEVYRLGSDGAWTREQAGSWGEAKVRALAVLPDGRAAALADSLHVLTDGVWAGQSVGGYFDQYHLRSCGHMRSGPGGLWLDEGSDILGGLPGSFVYRIVPGDGAWTLERIIAFDAGVRAAPRADGRLLLVSAAGRIAWLQDGVTTPDPAGRLRNVRNLCRLGDGAVAVLTGDGTLVLGENGLGSWDGLTPEAADYFRNYASDLVGASRADCWLDLRSMGLMHLVDGAVAGALGGDFRTGDRGLAWLPAEGLFQTREDVGVLRWAADEPVLDLPLPGDGTAKLVRGPEGSLAAWLDQGLWLRRDGSWEMLADPAGPASKGDVWIVHPLAGGEVAYGCYQDLYLSRPGVSQEWRTDLELSAGCPDLFPRCWVSTDLGLYAATDRPSRVFRLDDDPVTGSWSLVAGPCGGLISHLLVLADGSLLAEVDDRILLYRPDRF